MSSLFEIPSSALTPLSDRSRACIARLQVHESEEADVSGYPPSKLAAVLILLYEKAGELRVLLTTRSKLLRSHPGQTALPGGKRDDTDVDAVFNAYREAYEEVALPLECPDIHTVCTLRPFLSASKLLVTPVVALLVDLTVLDRLSPSADEVACIYTHPLESILDPSLASKEPLVAKGSEDWPYEADYHNSSDIVVPWLGNTGYRMHRFRTSASPIKGFTSEILITTAEIAYEREPVYERYCPGQLVGIAAAMRLLNLADDAPPFTSSESGTSTPLGISTDGIHVLRAHPQTST